MKTFEDKFDEFMDGLSELKWYWKEDDVQELYLMCMHIFEPNNPETVEYNKYKKDKKRQVLLQQLEELDREDKYNVT